VTAKGNNGYFEITASASISIMPPSRMMETMPSNALAGRWSAAGRW
jgi:hypothetical protein